MRRKAADGLSHARKMVAQKAKRGFDQGAETFHQTGLAEKQEIKQAVHQRSCQDCPQQVPND